MASAPSPAGPGVEPEITPFFDGGTNTVSCVVRDPSSASCAVIDSVLDFDYAAGRIEYRSADAIIAFIRERAPTREWLTETHVHADHLSAAPYIQSALGGRIGIGERITSVQDTFGKVFNEGTEFQRDGSQSDRLFAEGDTYAVGGMTAHVMHAPGHTPACMTHIFGDAAFAGDTLFMPDSGTARADFPGGDPRAVRVDQAHPRAAAGDPAVRLPRPRPERAQHPLGNHGHHARWNDDIAEVTGSAVNFPMISDPDRKVSALHGMIHPEADANLTVRSVFVSDPGKKVRLSLTYPPSAGRNFPEILRVVDSLQLTDAQKVATPVNWQPGDRVIIVPSVSDDDAKQRFPQGWEAKRPCLRCVDVSEAAE